MTQQAQQNEIEIGQLLLSLNNLIVRYKYLLLVFLILGTAFGFFMNKLSTPVYESSMTFESVLLSEGNINSMLNTLESLMDEKNAEEVGKKLNLSVAEAENLKQIIFSSKSQRVFRSNEDYTSVEYSVQIENTNNKLWDKVQVGLISYINETPYVKHKIEIEEKKLKTLIAELSTMVKENPNKNIGYDLENGTNIIVGEPFLIYKQIENYKVELALLSGVTMVEGFYPTNQSQNLSLTLILILSILGASTIAVMLIIFLEIRRFIQSKKSN